MSTYLTAIICCKGEIRGHSSLSIVALVVIVLIAAVAVAHYAVTNTLIKLFTLVKIEQVGRLLANQCGFNIRVYPSLSALCNNLTCFRIDSLRG